MSRREAIRALEQFVAWRSDPSTRRLAHQFIEEELYPCATGAMTGPGHQSFHQCQNYGGHGEHYTDHGFEYTDAQLSGKTIERDGKKYEIAFEPYS